MAHPADSMANPPDIIVEGEGVEIVDVDGHRTVDAVGGLWNVNLGFSCGPVKAAIAAQLDRLPYYSTFRGTTNDAAIELSFMLQEFFAPDGLSRAFFTSGGSDSVEVAPRLARQYHKMCGEAGRVKYLSLKKGYHGTHTLGASVNGNANFRTQYEPLMSGCFHIPAPSTYRNPFNETDPEKLAQLCLAALEDEVAFQGSGTIAAFIMEPVIGAGGVIVPHKSFMPSVREICDRHGILLIADEVVTGFGRAGAWFMSKEYGLSPDMIVLAKVICSGYVPMAAVLMSEDVAHTVNRLGPGNSYAGHAVGAAVGLAHIDIIERENLLENCMARGAQFLEELAPLKDHPLVGNIRGRGLIMGIELVSDKDTRAALIKDAPWLFADLPRYMRRKHGILLGLRANVVLLTPPLVINSAEVTRICDALIDTIGEVDPKTLRLPDLL